MPDQHDGLKKANANALTVAMLFGAVLLVGLGIMLPGLAGMAGTEGTILSIVLYVMAAFEVVIAFYLRGKIKKAQQSATSSGGTIQRQ